MAMGRNHLDDDVYLAQQDATYYYRLKILIEEKVFMGEMKLSRLFQNLITLIDY